MRTIRIILTSGKEINLVNNNQTLQEVLEAIEMENSNFVLIEEHSAIHKNHISAILDVSELYT